MVFVHPQYLWRLDRSNWSGSCQGWIPIWLWLKIKPPGIGPQVLLLVSIYQGKPFWGFLFLTNGHMGVGQK